MTDQTRAAFEAHFQLTQRQAWQHKDGSYQNTDVQKWWEGYQAGVAKAAPDYKAQRDMLIDFIRTAPVGTGTCCCGDDMKNHALDSHSPCDQWDYQVRLMVEQIEREGAAPVAAAAPGAVQEPNSWVCHDLLRPDLDPLVTFDKDLADSLASSIHPSDGKPMWRIEPLLR